VSEQKSTEDEKGIKTMNYASPSKQDSHLTFYICTVEPKGGGGFFASCLKKKREEPRVINESGLVCGKTGELSVLSKWTVNESKKRIYLTFVLVWGPATTKIKGGQGCAN